MRQGTAELHREQDPLRVVILAHNLRAAGGLSVGKNVIASLSRVRPQHEYLLLMPEDVGYESVEKPPHADCRYFERGRGWVRQHLFESFTIPARVREFRPDVIWGLGNFGLRGASCTQAVLVHKPHYFYGPEFYQTEMLRYRLQNVLGRRRLRRSLGSVQVVFCQTKTACDRFRRTYEFRGRVAVMPNAVSRLTLQGDQSAVPRVLEAPSGRFVLFCLTRYYAHKNLEVFFDVFERFRSELSDVTVVLTVQESDHPLARRFLSRLRGAGLNEHLLNVGPVPQSELAGYFAHSSGLILPTLLESFSGTYLEAMQFRRPILTSDLDFARDVCGPAARYFDPRDPASIRDAIVQLRDSPTLRDTLVKAGEERIRLFFRDWDSIVSDAMTEIENVLAGAPSGPVGMAEAATL